MAYPFNPADFQQTSPKLTDRSTGYGSKAGNQIKRPMDVVYGGPGGGSAGGAGGYSFGYNSLDPMGYDTYTKTATSQELAQKESYNQAREQRYQDWIREMMPQFGGNQMMVGLEAGGGGGATPPAHERIETPDSSAAMAASFARAKDRAGQIAQSALAGLRSNLGGRGLLGSGAEYKGTERIAAQGLGELGDVNREQAIQNANQAADFAKIGYQGDITQRGQDISAQQAANSLAAQIAMANFQGQISQRGQNMDMMQSLMNLIRY